jgi:phosphomannomutase/NDP-sugar pyrophosphorylase family protein
MQAVILAGERGTPLYPLTERQPRALLPLAAKPLVQFQLELLKEHGIDEAVLCLSAMPEMFEARFGDGKSLDMTLRYHRERFPLGTAGAVRAVMNRLIGGNVLVLNGHILSDADLTRLIEFHEERQAAVTMLLATVPNPADFGVVVTDAEGRITSFAEKPAREEAASDTINAGVYVLRRDVIFRMPPETEFSFERQLFPQLLAEGIPMYGLVQKDRYWRAISTLTDYQQGITDILERRVAAKIDGSEVREGVWVGEAATIHPTAELRGRVFINHHTEIARDARVSGVVSIGSRCRIEEGATVEDAVLWRGTVVEAGATVRGCILGDNCIVRAGATVQPGSVVGADAVIASVVAKLPSRGDIQRAGIKFGTEGWIGTIADDVTVDNVRVVTQAVCDWIRAGGKPGQGVVIGYDRRAQSDVFAEAVARVVAANGLRVLLSERDCPSPVVSFACRYYGASAGVMITASHFGPRFNGLKVKAHYGGATTADLLAQIETSLRNLLRSGVSPKVAPDLAPATDISRAYRAHLSRFANLKAVGEAKLKVVVDAMHGAGAGYLSGLLADAGVEVTEIRAERNPYFGGIVPEPVPENMGALFAAVREAGADVGISLDGDADQLAACDANGNYVDGNRIATVLLKYLYEERGWRGGVARDVATTRALDKLCAAYGLPLTETPIGFRYLGAAMLDADILLAATESGGIGFRGHLPDRDGMATALLLLEAMAAKGGRSLEQLTDEVFALVGRHEDARAEVHPPQERMHTIISALQSFRAPEFAGVAVASIVRKDGTLLNLADGSWLLLRPSGTEPVVRLYAEAESVARAEELLAAGVRLTEAG